MLEVNSTGLTVKELILRLEGKVDAFIVAHENRHQVESQSDLAARGDPQMSAAGRALDTRISDLTKDVDALGTMVRIHERTLQRVIGALALVTTLGIGTLGLLVLRIAGLAL